MSSLANTLVQGSAAIGRGYALMQMVMAIIISVILLLVSYKLLRRDRGYDVVEALVTKSVCHSYMETSTVNGQTTTSQHHICTCTVNYQSGGTSYTGSITVDEDVAKGGSIQILVNDKNPKEIFPYDKMLSYIAYGLIAFSILITFGTVSTYMMAKSYTAVASIDGASDVLGML